MLTLEKLGVPTGKHAVVVPGRTGHETLVYDPTNTKEVADTKQKFDELIEVNRMNAIDLDHGEVTRDFDPEVELYEFVGQYQGG